MLKWVVAHSRSTSKNFFFVFHCFQSLENTKKIKYSYFFSRILKKIYTNLCYSILQIFQIIFLKIYVICFTSNPNKFIKVFFFTFFFLNSGPCCPKFFKTSWCNINQTKFIKYLFHYPKTQINLFKFFSFFPLFKFYTL